MNNQATNPTIPSFKIYENPETQYQLVVNRFCQSKSKLMNCASKKDAIEKANTFWQGNKSNKSFCNTYIQSPPTFPVKKKLTQPTIISFTKNPSLNSMLNENNDKKEENHSQSKPNERRSKRKADQMINQEPVHIHNQEKVKKMKSMLAYDLDAIIQYFSRVDREEIAQDMKVKLKNLMNQNIEINHNMYASLSKFIEEKKKYDSLSSFSKDNESTTNLKKLEKEISDYKSNLLKLIDLKEQLMQSVDVSNLMLMMQKEKIDKIELEILDMNQMLPLNMVNISTLISVLLPIISKRVANCKHYKKSILVPNLIDPVFKFQCFNLESDWDYTKKLINIVLSEEGNIYPMQDRHAKDIIDLFKDHDILAIKLATIYSFLFSSGADESHQSKKGRMQALNTILIKLFPLLSFKCSNDIYLIDVAKINETKEGMLDFISEILENEPSVVSTKEQILQNKSTEESSNLKVSNSQENGLSHLQFFQYKRKNETNDQAHLDLKINEIKDREWNHEREIEFLSNRMELELSFKEPFEIKEDANSEAKMNNSNVIGEITYDKEFENTNLEQHKPEIMNLMSNQSKPETINAINYQSKGGIFINNFSNLFT